MDQPRDEKGQFASTGSSGGGAPKSDVAANRERIDRAMTNRAVTMLQKKADAGNISKADAKTLESLKKQQEAHAVEAHASESSRLAVAKQRVDKLNDAFGSAHDALSAAQAKLRSADSAVLKAKTAPNVTAQSEALKTVRSAMSKVDRTRGLLHRAQDKALGK